MRPIHSHWRLIHLAGERNGSPSATNETRVVLGEVTLGDLEDLVRLACFVTPRGHDEQALLMKVANELEHAGGVNLCEDVSASAGAVHYALPIPESKGAIVTAAAVGTAVVAGVEAMRRRGHRRRRRFSPAKAVALAVAARQATRHLPRPHPLRHSRSHRHHEESAGSSRHRHRD